MPWRRSWRSTERASQSPAARSRTGAGTFRATTLLVAGALLFAVVTPTLAARSVRSSLFLTPQATARSFLTAAVVDHDGFSASRYLSPRARLSFEDRSSTGPTADSFFSASHLTLGGLAVQSNTQLKALSYRVMPAGRDRIVEIGHNGQSIYFLLRHASPTDRGEFHAPPTTWRIDSSVAALGSAPPRGVGGEQTVSERSGTRDGARATPPHDDGAPERPWRVEGSRDVNSKLDPVASSVSTRGEWEISGDADSRQDQSALRSAAVAQASAASAPMPVSR